MARDEPLLRIRVPDELKARLERAKDDNRRSLNAEIRMRLEWSFDAGFDGGAITPAMDQASELEALAERLERLEALVTKLDPDSGASLVPHFTDEEKESPSKVLLAKTKTRRD